MSATLLRIGNLYVGGSAILKGAQALFGRGLRISLSVGFFMNVLILVLGFVLVYTDFKPLSGLPGPISGNMQFINTNNGRAATQAILALLGGVSKTYGLIIAAFTWYMGTTGVKYPSPGSKWF